MGKVITNAQGVIPVLSPSEEESLRLVLSGKTNREAAAVRVCSVRTIDFHLANAHKKLGVKRRLDALNKAVQLGIVSIK